MAATSDLSRLGIRSGAVSMLQEIIKLQKILGENQPCGIHRRSDVAFGAMVACSCAPGRQHLEMY